MKYRISDVKKNLASNLHSTNTDKIHDVYGVIESGIRQVLGEIDVEETRRKAELPFVYLDNPIMALPVDLKKKKIISLKVNGSDDFRLQLSSSKLNSEPFVDIKYFNGFKAMEIEGVEVPDSLMLFDFDTVTDIIGDNIQNIFKDRLDYIQGNASISFAQESHGIFHFVKPIDSTDIIGHVDESTFYTFIKVPPRASLQQVEMKLGSSETDYVSFISQGTVYGTSFIEGWNLVKFNWEESEVVGTPDYQAINQIRFDFADTSGLALSGWKVDAITSNIEAKSEIEYYSNFVFVNEDGILSDRIQGDNTLLVIDDSYELFLAKITQLATQHAHDYGYSPGSSETGYWAGKYMQLKKDYLKDLPSSAKFTSTKYYKTRKRRL